MDLIAMIIKNLLLY